MVPEIVAHPAVRFTCVADARGGRLAITLHGELDLACSDLLGKAADVDEDDDTLNEVVVDMAALEFIDTAGVRALAEVQSRNLMLGRSVALVNPRPLVQRVVTLYGREDLLALG